MGPAEFLARVARQRAKDAKALQARGDTSRKSGPAAGRTRQPTLQSIAERKLRELDRNPVAKAVAGWAAREVAKPVGHARAVRNLAQDAMFVGRLANPRDLEAKSQALLGAAAAGRNAVRTTVWAAQNPDKAVRAVTEKAKQTYRDLEPSATPMAPTIRGEVARNLPIGANQGEFQVNYAPVPVAPTVRLAQIAGRLARPMTKADYMAMGFPEGKAAYFAERYARAGHHAAVPARTIRRTKNPVLRAALRLVGEGPFGMKGPEGLTIGQFYREHYLLDPHYHGGPIPKRHGGGSWSGKKDFGPTKYDRLTRFRKGIPGPTQDVASVGLTAPISTGSYLAEDERE